MADYTNLVAMPVLGEHPGAGGDIAVDDVLSCSLPKSGGGGLSASR